MSMGSRDRSRLTATVMPGGLKDAWDTHEASMAPVASLSLRAGRGELRWWSYDGSHSDGAAMGATVAELPGELQWWTGWPLQVGMECHTLAPLFASLTGP